MLVGASAPAWFSALAAGACVAALVIPRVPLGPPGMRAGARGWDMRLYRELRGRAGRRAWEQPGGTAAGNGLGLGPCCLIVLCLCE